MFLFFTFFACPREKGLNYFDGLSPEPMFLNIPDNFSAYLTFKSYIPSSLMVNFSSQSHHLYNKGNTISFWIDAQSFFLYSSLPVDAPFYIWVIPKGTCSKGIYYFHINNDNNLDITFNEDISSFCLFVEANSSKEFSTDIVNVKSSSSITVYDGNLNVIISNEDNNYHIQGGYFISQSSPFFLRTLSL
jgi:hypothetical protein